MHVEIVRKISVAAVILFRESIVVASLESRRIFTLVYYFLVEFLVNDLIIKNGLSGKHGRRFRRVSIEIDNAEIDNAENGKTCLWSTCSGPLRRLVCRVTRVRLCALDSYAFLFDFRRGSASINRLRNW